MPYSLNNKPAYANTIINGNLEFYQNSKELLNIFKDVLGVIQFNLLIEKGKTSDNVLKDLTEAYTLLDVVNGKNKFVLVDSVTEKQEFESVNLPGNEETNTEDGVVFEPLPEQAISNSFIYQYIEDFKNLQDSLKLFILKKTGEDSVFQNFSEDIGFTLDQGSKQSCFNSQRDDYFYETEEFGPPTYIPGNVRNKISEQAETLAKTLGLKTDGLMRWNLQGISETNLFTDVAFARGVFEELKDIKTSKIVIKFGRDMGKIISFYKNLNLRDQRTETSFLQLQAKVEDVENYLDIFNNNIFSSTIIDNSTLS
jgi:hypothetical protein|tara:strand:- start:1812 stop:2744 length:933 start_codon:yes stop_codon:yes gene_type:complete